MRSLEKISYVVKLKNLLDRSKVEKCVIWSDSSVCPKN